MGRLSRKSAVAIIAIALILGMSACSKDENSGSISNDNSGEVINAGENNDDTSVSKAEIWEHPEPEEMRFFPEEENYYVVASEQMLSDYESGRVTTVISGKLPKNNAKNRGSRYEFVGESGAEVLYKVTGKGYTQINITNVAEYNDFMRLNFKSDSDDCEALTILYKSYGETVVNYRVHGVNGITGLETLVHDAFATTTPINSDFSIIIGSNGNWELTLESLGTTKNNMPEFFGSYVSPVFNIDMLTYEKLKLEVSGDPYDSATLYYLDNIDNYKWRTRHVTVNSEDNTDMTLVETKYVKDGTPCFIVTNTYNEEIMGGLYEYIPEESEEDNIDD